ncbi:uncharacterized protein LOC141629688 [Silene latifolia]|uniref:uncharacterized protein LOC141629688 n=1 Tax=Silene latifolia TaxID=37657 RepID=UPI003D7850D6
MIEDIRANPVISAQSIKVLLMKRHGLEMVSSSVYKMKEIALREINGGHDESYKLLCQYVEMIKLTNPRSIAHYSGTYMGNPEKTLQFKGFRSLIGVDGAHLKGNHGGVLSFAVALDGNNEIFSVAIALVEAENKDSWCSLFTFLKQCVVESGRTNWTIISDRQKKVLCSTFMQEFQAAISWIIAVQTVLDGFKCNTRVHIQESFRASCSTWFLDLGDKEQWTKHKFDPELSCEDNTSNFVESFNSTLGVHRTNPVLSLLEGVRRMTMVRNAARQKVAQSWPDEGVCPNILERLKKLQKESRLCYGHASGNGEFEVQDGGFHFPISGIPCKHAIREILEAKRNPKDYVSDWFSVKRYKETYGLSIHPIADKAHWPVFYVPYLEPPTLSRSIGRPSRNRRREPGEEQKKGKRSVIVKCTKCGCFGHNKKTCKGGYTAKQRQELQGKFTKKPAHQGLSKASTSNFSSLNYLETIIMESASTSTQPQWPYFAIR